MKENITIVHPSELKAVYIGDQADILDALGLADKRKEMDAAHNKVLDKKVVLKQKRDGAIPIVTTTVNSPFDTDALDMISPEVERYKAHLASNLLRQSTLNDAEYKEATKKFLDGIMPTIESKADELDAAIVEAVNEYNTTMAYLKHQITIAKNNKARFLHDVSDATMRKFNAVNSAEMVAPDGTVFRIDDVSPLCHALPYINKDIIHQLRYIRTTID